MPFVQFADELSAQYPQDMLRFRIGPFANLRPALHIRRLRTKVRCY